MVPKLLRNKQVVALLTIASMLVLLSCNKSDPQSTFDAAGPIAAKQLELFWIIFWAAVVVFVIVEGILFYTVVRYARRRGDNRMPAQTHPWKSAGPSPLQSFWL